MNDSNFQSNRFVTLLSQMKRPAYLNLITKDPQVKSGEPCIRGLPVAVADITRCWLKGLTIQLSLAKHQQITREDIMATIAFISDQPLGTCSYPV